MSRARIPICTPCGIALARRANPVLPAWFHGETFGSALVFTTLGLGVIAYLAWVFTPSQPQSAPALQGGLPEWDLPKSHGFVPGSCDLSHVPAGCPSEAVPAGYKTWNGKSNRDQVIAFIRSYTLGDPLDTWANFIINDTEYKAHVVCHAHPCNGPVYPHGWHAGVTVYEKIGAVA